ncbi:unnamed protein product, partial [Closterium sp. Naga37s-1]
VVSMGALDADSAKALTDMGIRGVTWDDFLKEGEEKPVEPCPSKPEDICTIMYTSGGFRWFVMYTSGTTGEPKGVLITNHALATAVAGTKRFCELTEADIYISYLPLAHIFDRLTEADIYISYLPLAHIFDRVAEELMTHVYGTHIVAEELMALKPAPPHTLALFLFASLLSSPPLHLYARHSPYPTRTPLSPTLLTHPALPPLSFPLRSPRTSTPFFPTPSGREEPHNDLEALKPTFFCGVPRIFDRIHSAVISKIESTGGLTKMLFDYAYSSKQARLTHLPPLFPLPTLFPLTIPAVISKIESTGGLTKMLFDYAYSSKQARLAAGVGGWVGGWVAAGVKIRDATPIFDFLVFSKIKARLGGNVRIICSGAAPLAPHVEEFLKIAMCCPVVQGYGEFESGTVRLRGTVSPPHGAGVWPHGDQHERLHLVRGSHRAGHHCWAAHAQPSHSYAPHNPFLCRRFSLTPPGLTETNTSGFISYADRIEQAGTVGPPMPTLETRLESIPEMNYDAIGSTKQEGESGEAQVHPPRGEVCIRGPILFSGYYKREDLTKEAVDAEGWFHTGDIGEWQADGSMKIIDRKKNIFKLAQGEYVAVENLENVFGNCTALDMSSKLAQGEYVAVEKLENMFGNCTALDMSSKLAQGEYVAVEKLENMFGNCTALDMSSKLAQGEYVAVEKLENMFGNCTALDMSSKLAQGEYVAVEKLENMFGNCTALDMSSKLAQGEYVAVEKLENMFGNCTALDMVWVYGNSFEAVLVAVVVPNKPTLLEWAKGAGVEGDYAAVCATEEAKKFILGQLTDTGKKGKLKGFEMVKAVHLDSQPFDMERDLLTPTFKKKRAAAA